MFCGSVKQAYGAVLLIHSFQIVKDNFRVTKKYRTICIYKAVFWQASQSAVYNQIKSQLMVSTKIPVQTYQAKSQITVSAKMPN